jgi:hypothetical protein
MVSETETVTLLGELRSVLYGDVSEQVNDITMEKLHECMKNMESSINSRLNSMSEKIRKSTILWKKLMRCVNKW